MNGASPQPDAEQDPRVREIARALASGTPVDWDAAESSAPNDAVRDLIRELRILSTIADLTDGRTTDVSLDGAAAPPGGAAALVTWGPLVLHEKIGDGSFGEVYRAWDPRLDRELALKLLRPGRTPADDRASTVVAEGRALARVRHPNVVTVFGADRIEGRVGVWMEYIHGRTLEEVLHDHGPLSAREATLAGIDVCRALAAIHGQGLLHRDIKAQNVMREEGGRTVLMDFGTAVAVRGEPDDNTALAGTPLYLAPEVMGGGPPSIASDVYAIGILLFHLVTGSFPVGGRTLGEIRQAHATGHRRLLRDLRADLPRSFIEAIDRAAASSPTQRFATAGALETALAACLAQASGVERTEVREPVEPFWRAGLAARRGLGRWAAIASALVVMLAATIALLAVRPRSNSRGAGRPDHGSTPALVPTGPSTRKLTIPAWSVVGRPAHDGSFVPYADEQGELALFDVASGGSRALTHAAGSGEEAGLAAPSHDGTLIAYSWHALDGALELRTVRADGTRPRVLLRPQRATEISPLDWTPDGSAVLTSIEDTDRRHRLMLIDARGESAPRVVKDLGTSRPLLASVSPDGTHVAYDAWAGGPSGSRDVFVIRSDGREERPVAATEATEAFPVWSAGSDAIAFVSGGLGVPSLWEQVVTGGQASGPPRFLARDLGRIMGLGLSARGQYFYVQQAGVVDVHVADPRAGWRVARGSASGSAGQSLAPAWSPDGSLAWVEIAGYIRADRGHRRLMILPIGGDHPQALRPDLAFFLMPAWSPAGRDLVVIGTDSRNRWGLHRVHAETGSTTPVLVAPSGDEGWFQAAQWLSGTEIAYAAGSRVVRRDLASGDEITLVDAPEEGLTSLHAAAFGGRVFQVSPDRTSIAFSGYVGEPPSVTHVVRAKLLGGASRTLAESARPERVVFQAWSEDGRRVYFTRSSSGQPDVTLWSAGLDGGDARSTGVTYAHLRDVSVDARSGRVAFTGGSERYEVWVLEGVVPAAQVP
jgi:eukaryotic-like serine/threonine-protein kinase